MTQTRRQFLQRGALLLPAAAAMPGVMVKALYGAVNGSTKNLILVDLDGGNDGLNTVIPFGLNGGTYYTEYRSSLAVPESSVLKIDTEIGFHPSFSHLKTHFDAGKVALIQGVHYPNANFSHEVSSRIWDSGSEDPAVLDGWMGRMLSLYPAPAFPNAMAASSNLPRVYFGANGFVPAFTSTSSFKFPYDSSNWSDKDNRRVAYEAGVNASVAGGPNISEMGAIGVGVLDLIDTFQTMPELTEVGDYPDHYFSNSLRLVARLMNANLGMNIFRVSLGGFDTHDEQEVDNHHTERLQIVSQGVNALYDDVAAMGKAADTVFVIYSEFGRTVYENGSGGTDHGTVNPVFVFGDGVTGGIVSPHPSMDPGQLDPQHDELAMNTDFRDVFGTVISDIYGANPAVVFPGHSFTDLGFMGP